MPFDLRQNPLLVLFIVATLGYLFGRIRIRGVSLGVAACLFVGLAIGATDPTLRLPEVLQTFGLVLFIYTIGLTNGPTFLSALKKDGLKHCLLTVLVLFVGAIVTLALTLTQGGNSGLAAGVFAGSLTNTPALANAVQYLQEHLNEFVNNVQLNDPVIGYSLTYPIGVLGPIFAIVIAYRLFGRKRAPTPTQIDPGESGEYLKNITIQIDIDLDPGITVADLLDRYSWDIMFVRIKPAAHPDRILLCHLNTVISKGDLVSVLGHPQNVNAAISVLGHCTENHLEFDRTTLDFRRMFVSNQQIAGKCVSDLQLQKFGALITRIKRGDRDFLPDGYTILELGDRVRVVAERSQMPVIAGIFGDSYKSLSEIDFMPLGFGIAIGFLLGLIPIPLPGGVTFKLGVAVGPLIAGLFFGWLERSRKIVWQLPYSANLTLRQLGLVLFLSGVGINAGNAFFVAVSTWQGVLLLLTGVAVTFSVAMFTILLGLFAFRIPLDTLAGTLAGINTQPAVLAFASEKTGNDAPGAGYLLVFPLATILKVFLTQWILLY